MKRSSSRPARILVLGYLVRFPLGGMAWHYLQYAMGLKALGHDVYFFEDSDDYESCYDPASSTMSRDPGAGLRFASRTFERVGLGSRWAYHDAHTARWHGPCADRADSLCTGADLLLNVSGLHPLRPWMAGVPARALIDTDPVFKQIQHLTQPRSRELALGHTAFFTFGHNSAPDGDVPDDGLPWQPTRQPIVLDAWPVTPGPASGNYTTVMQWESYAPKEHGGRSYGMKSESFGPYLDLPARSGVGLEMALGGRKAPRGRLRGAGWHLSNPIEATRDPWIYQDFIRRSKAEFSVAKHGYVTARCGWFSERTAAYLASGRPVVVEQTGFSDWLDDRGGVFAFGDPDEALAGIREIDRRYAFHCHNARRTAEANFDSRIVLSDLVDRAMRV